MMPKQRWVEKPAWTKPAWTKRLLSHSMEGGLSVECDSVE